MNREMILRVADAIEAAEKPEAKPAIGFNMAAYICEGGMPESDMTGHDCGTTACIAGWIIHVAGSSIDAIVEEDKEKEDDLETRGVPERAANLIGLPLGKAWDLFHPSLRRSNWRSIPPSQAVSVLRHLAETGDVDWSIAERGVVA